MPARLAELSSPFEPDGPWSWRALRCSTRLNCARERPGGFEPPHAPWQGGRLPGYIMDASSGGWLRPSDLHVFSVTLLPSELHRNILRGWHALSGAKGVEGTMPTPFTLFRACHPAVPSAQAPGAGIEPTPAG